MKLVMKHLIAAAVFAPILSPMTSLAANTQSLKTLLTCQQEDGDQWIEVGIVAGADLKAYVVTHNADDGSSKLVASKIVREVNSGSATAFHDPEQNFGLFTERLSGNKVVGKVILADDGPVSLSKSGLTCYDNSTIEFDIR